GVYIGTLRQGIPHGQGYFEYANQGGWYEGAIVDGKYEGAGIYLSANRSRYTGYWKAGKRHGFGEETFGLGGAYKGQWENDVAHGRGTITYAGSGHAGSGHAGSGRKYEGEFRDGRIAGLAPLEVDTKRYVMKEAPRVGSHLPEERATSLFPPAAKWEELSEVQKNTLRTMYPALERGDDPPYPLYGTRELYQAVLRQTELHDGVFGTVNVLLMVGADGKPKQANIVATTNPQLAKVVATTMMVQKYKPASCQGKPCDMAYPVDLDYGIK
ncbi:MAG: energy transducer TonB, partial [Telluria sp.]